MLQERRQRSKSLRRHILQQHNQPSKPLHLQVLGMMDPVGAVLGGIQRRQDALQARILKPIYYPTYLEGGGNL